MNSTESIRQLPILPQNAQAVIIVLGQCALPTGQPHPWLIERGKKTYQLLIAQKLNLETTYVIVSGSDVSNRQYCIEDKKKKHISEALMLYRLLNEIHQARKKQVHEGKLVGYVCSQNVDFGSHILIQDQANTTIQNFYYSFKIINSSLSAKKLKKIYVITSDFHMNRTKFVFQTLFFNGSQQVIGNQQTFNFKNQVEFIESETKWKSQYEKKQKLEKQEGLLHLSYLVQDAKQTSKRLWSELKKLE